jgi:hypothetical protein
VPRSVYLGRVVAKGEAVWTEEDRAWAEALIAWEADQHACGRPWSEASATKLDDRGRRVPAHVYEAEAVECYACREVAIAHEDMSEHPYRHALSYAVTRLD